MKKLKIDENLMKLKDYSSKKRIIEAKKRIKRGYYNSNNVSNELIDKFSDIFNSLLDEE